MFEIEWKDIKHLIPYSGIFLIFISFFRLTLYYDAFNIQINQFLDLSEIVTSALNDLLYVGLILLWIILFDFLTTSNEDRNRRADVQERFINSNSFKSRLIHWVKVSSPLLLIEAIFLIIALIQHFKYGGVSFFVLIMIIQSSIVFALAFILIEYRRRHFLVYGTKLNVSISNLILYSGLICSLMFIKTELEIDETKTDKCFIGTSFKFDGGIIVSDSLHYYIGQTHNFLFYYDQTKNTTTVYPLSQIQQISFTRNN